jgi:ABC-type sulfate/molybdate transport systems ATPase subunit
MSLSATIAVSRPIAIEGGLRCEANQLLALVGPSGSGKSTVLRVLAGLLKSSSRVVVEGEDWSALPTHRREIGLVTQQYNLLPHLTAIENIAMGIPAAQHDRLQQAQDWLARVSLSGLGVRLPAQLSGGQQQRVALARALARRPKLLLLDEPFSAVDAATRQRLYEALMALREEIQCPTVLVTHDVKEAGMLANEIAVLSQGKILGQGPAVEMLTQPQSAQIARVMGWRNVIPIARFLSVAQWRNHSVVQAMPPAVMAQGHVLVAHRQVRISSTSPGAEGRLMAVLRLPHTAWAHAQVGHAHIWGVMDTSETLRVGEACWVSFPDEACRVVV